MCFCGHYPYPHREGSGVCGDDAKYYASLEHKGYRRPENGVDQVGEDAGHDLGCIGLDDWLAA